MEDNKSKDNRASQGIVFVSTAVEIVFIVLKLTGVIDWSWWAVTAPVWVSIAIPFAVAIMALFGIVCIMLYKTLARMTAKKEA